MAGFHYELSLQTYQALLERLNLGEPHPTLSRPPIWYDTDVRAAIDIAVDDELSRQGITRRGQIDSNFREILYLVQTAPTEYYCYNTIDEKEITFRVAYGQRDGILITSTVDSLSIVPTQADIAAQDLIAQLPEVPAARLRSLSCALEDYRLVLADKAPLNATSRSLADARQIARIFKEKPPNRGTLYAAIRDRWGSRIRVPQPAQWGDTPTGRILGDVDPKGWLNLMGASPQDLVNKLHQLKARLT